jgi:hypothetical protein
LGTEAIMALPNVEGFGGIRTFEGRYVLSNRTEEYDAEVGAYLTRHSEYADALFEHEVRAALTVPIVLKVSNVGAATARDANIRIRTVDRSSFLIAGRNAERPTAPEPPDPRAFDTHGAMMIRLEKQANYGALLKNAQTTEIESEWDELDEGVWEKHVLLIHPGRDLDLPPIFASPTVITEGEDRKVGTLSILIELVCDGMPRSETLRIDLPFVVTPKPLKPPSVIDRLIANYGEQARAERSPTASNTTVVTDGPS